MSRSEGFTLIELLIAVVIIGILAAVAIPSYTQYVINARQSEAQQSMMDLASRLEQYRLDAREYPDDLGTGANELEFDPPPGVANHYTVTISTTTGPPTYTITASPKSGTRVAGTGDLTLDSAGNKKPADEW